MKVGILLFEQYHQMKSAGSSRIRGRWIIDNWDEAEQFQQGMDYNVLIYQKVFWKEHARGFKGLKILDLCDPDWLDGMEVVNFLKDVDVITCSSKRLKESVGMFTDKPVYFIPDRIDLTTLPKPKVHKGKAKKCVWFGYFHNIEMLEQAYHKIKQENMTLKVISNGNLNIRECNIENVKWEETTVNDEIQEADFVLMPEYKTGRFEYKSNNKIVYSWALGLPVVTNPEEFEKFMNEEERIKESEKRLKEVKEKYDVKLSVEEFKKIIKLYGR